MLVRLVRMTFKEHHVSEFLEIFREVQPRIKAFPGCRQVELYRDTQHPSVYVTHSLWDHQQALDDYRNSAFFKEVWARTKEMFDAPPQAFSMKNVQVFSAPE